MDYIKTEKIIQQNNIAQRKNTNIPTKIEIEKEWIEEEEKSKEKRDIEKRRKETRNIGFEMQCNAYNHRPKWIKLLQ